LTFFFDIFFCFFFFIFFFDIFFDKIKKKSWQNIKHGDCDCFYQQILRDPTKWRNGHRLVGFTFRYLVQEMRKKCSGTSKLNAGSTRKVLTSKKSASSKYLGDCKIEWPSELKRSVELLAGTSSDAIGTTGAVQQGGVPNANHHRNHLDARSRDNERPCTELLTAQPCVSMSLDSPRVDLPHDDDKIDKTLKKNAHKS
jgi:hypothetical protein